MRQNERENICKKIISIIDLDDNKYLFIVSKSYIEVCKNILNFCIL